MLSIDPATAHKRVRAGLAAHLLLGAAAWLIFTGCTHSRDGPAPAVTGAPALAGPGKVVAPLPAQTPFDRNPKLRAAFLESYARGYDLAFANTEYASPGCLCEGQGDPEWHEATVEGFFAGKQAGSAAYLAQQAKAESATSTAPK